MPDEILLNEAAYAVWQTVKEHGPIELGEVVKQTGIDQAQVSAAATEAMKSGYFEIKEREREELIADGRCSEHASVEICQNCKAAIRLLYLPKMPMQEFVELGKSKRNCGE